LILTLEIIKFLIYLFNNYNYDSGTTKDGNIGPTIMTKNRKDTSLIDTKCINIITTDTLTMATLASLQNILIVILKIKNYGFQVKYRVN
jgi:hypothetical protein